MAPTDSGMSDLTALTALYEATRRIGLSDNLDQLLDTVLEQAQELIGFDHCALMLYDPERELLSVKRARGYGDRAEEVRSLVLRKGEGLSGWAVLHRQAARVNDVSADPRYVVGLRKARSNLSVPLVVANEVAGVINVESERKNAFTEEHEKLLTVLGAQAALAILAARARDRLHHRINQLNGLYRISQLAAVHDDLDETLASILAVAEELVPEGQVAVLLADESCRCLVVRAARGYAEGVEHLRIPLGEGVTGRCAVTGEVLVVDDVRADPGYIPGVPGARSEIALPLKVEGRVIGVLNAESKAPKAYNEDHVRALSVIAQQAAVVIRSAQLNEEARRLAITDPLTGLHNRRYFVQRLEEDLLRAHRYGQPLALLLADADCLKAINDRHGHLTGDLALQAVAEVMRVTLRETDELARIGGDEFAALLLEAGPDRALSVARRLQDRIHALDIRSDDGHPVPITISLGVALFPDHGEDAKALLREADYALYRSKRDGRDQLSMAPMSDRFRPSAAESRADEAADGKRAHAPAKKAGPPR